MNILVLSEKYSAGGLETHINTYYEYLKHEHNFVFAFGEYHQSEYLKDAKIIEGLKFSNSVTIEEFCNTVETLINIIKENKIDVIHAHPFYTLFPAVFAANETCTKLVYTYHGYGSINFVNGPIDSILFPFFIEQFISKIFCVAENILPWFNKFEKKQAYYIPNVIDETKLKEHTPSLNKSWALLSRLDNDKIPEIAKFLKLLKKLDIKKVDIYGKGNKEEELKQLVKSLRLGKVVNFKGYVENLNEHIDNYTGTIGLGRVSMESLCMNYPSILAGYGKVIGVIDKETFDEVKGLNFVPSELEEKTEAEIISQIEEINKGNFKKYQLRKETIEEFGLSHINEYINEIKKCKKISLKIISTIYSEISNIEQKSDLFYETEYVFRVLQKNISSYTKNILLKNLINQYSENYKYKYLIHINENRIIKITEELDNLKKNHETELKDIKNSQETKDQITNDKIANLNQRLYTLEINRSLFKRLYMKIFKGK